MTRRTPRDFCGDAWPLLAELRKDEHVRGCYLVREVGRERTRQQQPYVRLVLADRSGTIEARAWDGFDDWLDACRPGSVVGVEGGVVAYQNRLQLRVDRLEPLEVPADERDRFVPCSPWDPGTLERELDAEIHAIRDPALRAVVGCLLGSRSAVGQAFRAHPAAQRLHHAYRGGLLEHTLSVCRLAVRLAEHYRERLDPATPPALDVDLLRAGALLHDIGKVLELDAGAAGAYTTAGRLLGHIVLGLELVTQAARDVGLADERLRLLQHLVASHQGKLEWGSPARPACLEALLLHYADDLDAKVHRAWTALRHLPDGAWTDMDRAFDTPLYRPAVPPPETPPARHATRTSSAAQPTLWTSEE